MWALPWRTWVRPNTSTSKMTGWDTMNLKLVTASHVAEQFSRVPRPCCSPPGLSFPIKSFALSAHVSSQTIPVWGVDKSRFSGSGRGPVPVTIVWPWTDRDQPQTGELIIAIDQAAFWGKCHSLRSHDFNSRCTHPCHFNWRICTAVSICAQCDWYFRYCLKDYMISYWNKNYYVCLRSQEKSIETFDITDTNITVVKLLKFCIFLQSNNHVFNRT